MFPNLNAEMARRKITQKSLAERIGRTPTTLSLKLSGVAPITLVECVEIKNAIDEKLSVDYLFSTEVGVQSEP